jgi:hypothetical protein
LVKFAQITFKSVVLKGEIRVHIGSAAGTTQDMLFFGHLRNHFFLELLLRERLNHHSERDLRRLGH